MKKIIIAILLLALGACGHIDPHMTQQPKVYRDAPLDLSELAVYIQPKTRQYRPVKAMFYPFWVAQRSEHPLLLGRQFGKIFHQTWAAEELFPVLLFDEDVEYKGYERAVSVARSRGMDVVIIGTIPHFLDGGTRGDSAISVQLKIYDAYRGQLICSMEQAGRIEAKLAKDWILWSGRTRLPANPLPALLAAIAKDMAIPLRSWLPPMGSDLRFVTTSEEIVQELTKEPAQPATPTGTGMERRLSETMNPNMPGVNLKIEFDVDKSTIRNSSYPLLDELGRALNSPALKGKRISISGHTDSDASDDYNMNLSHERAFAVKKYLVTKLGIPAELISARGYGETRPLAPNSTDANKQLNRRVEVRLME